MVKDYKWLVNLQSRTWRNFKRQNPMTKRTRKIHLSANYVTQSKSNLEASLENPVGLYFLLKKLIRKIQFTSGIVIDVDVNLNLINRIYTVSFLTREKDIM